MHCLADDATNLYAVTTYFPPSTMPSRWQAITRRHEVPMLDYRQRIRSSIRRELAKHLEALQSEDREAFDSSTGAEDVIVAVEQLSSVSRTPVSRSLCRCRRM